MKKTTLLSCLITFLAILFPQPAFAGSELKCEAWLQSAGGELKKYPLKSTEITHLRVKQEAAVEGYTFKVNYDVNLDALYTEILEGTIRLLFTTGRVPTFLHNDSFTDLKLPSGQRLAVSCNFLIN